MVLSDILNYMYDAWLELRISIIMQTLTVFQDFLVITFLTVKNS